MIVNAWRQLKLLFAKDWRLFWLNSGYVYISLAFFLGAILVIKLAAPLKSFNPQLFTDNVLLIQAWYQEKAIFLTVVMLLCQIIVTVFMAMATYEWELKDYALRYLKLRQIDPHFVYFTKTLSIGITLWILWLCLCAIVAFFLGQDFFNTTSVGFLRDRLIDHGVTYFGLAGLFLSFAFGVIAQMTALIAFHSRFKLALMLVMFVPLTLPIVVNVGRFFSDFFLATTIPPLADFALVMSGYFLVYFALVYFLYDFLWLE